MGAPQKAADTLGRLLVQELSAVEAYDTALARLDNEAFRAALSGYRLAHEAHIAQLRAALSEINAQGAPEAGLSGLLAAGKVAAADLVGGQLIIQALKSVESGAIAAYEHALEAEWAPPLRIMLEQMCAALTHQRNWLESVLDEM